MKLRGLVCSSVLALACGPAHVDSGEPESVGEEAAKLVAPGGSGVLLFARDGEAALVVLNGNNFVGMASYKPGGTWRPIATGDFNGDGHGDILWRDANDRGHLSIWEMFGGRLVTYTENPTSPGWFSGWGTPMVANFNGDSVNDILWKGATISGIIPNQTTIPVTERWTMQAHSAVPTAISYSNDPGWMVAGVGNFYNDGIPQTDLFWTSTDGSSTRFDVRGGGPYAGPNVSPDWQVKGVTDFDADGIDDILWRNRVTGDVSIWPITWGWPRSYPLVANVSTGWDLVGTGDTNGDGVGELVWRGQNPDIAVTLLNSDFTVKAYGPSIPLDKDYKFVGVLRAPGKFGFGKLIVTKPRNKPDACPTWAFTIQGTNGPAVTQNIAPQSNYPDVCGYLLQMADLQDSYTVTYPGGCQKFNIIGFQSTSLTASAGDHCAPPTPPPMTTPPPVTPPQPPQQVSSGALLMLWGGGPAPLEGNIWYGGVFPPVPVSSGSAVKITNPNSFVLGFPTAGHTTDDCNDSTKTIVLGPGASLSSAQMTQIYGTSQPRLPIGLVACAGFYPVPNPLPMSILATVTHIAQ